MAVLSKIRQRSFFLIVIIALALFSFILTDLIKNGSFGSDANSVGEVNGKRIDRNEYAYSVEYRDKQSQGRMSHNQISNQVWNEFVRKILLEEEFNSLGLRVSKDQLKTILEDNLSKMPQFQSEDGKLDRAKFNELVRARESSNDPAWDEYLKTTVFNHKNGIYNSLIKGSVYATELEGKFKHYIENQKISFDYVTVPYSTIDDDKASVSDQEIIDYVKSHPKKYQSETSASLNYVFFENNPSETDSKNLEDQILKFKNDLENNQNVVNLINLESDLKFDSIYLVKNDLPKEYQENLFNLKKDSVFGPYVQNEHQCVSKLLDRKKNAQVKVAHILIGYKGNQGSMPTERSKEEAQKIANDLLKKIKSGSDKIEDLAKIHSEDPGSKSKGGIYDNVPEGQMVPPFNDFIFGNKIGDKGVVETQFGFHVIQILDQYEGVLLGTITKKIEPSTQTLDLLYERASDFEAMVVQNGIEAASKEKKYLVKKVENLKSVDENVGELGSERPIVNWVFTEAEQGDVKRFNTSKGYVIVQLTEYNTTGLKSVESVRAEVEPILKNKKKASIIKGKFNGSSLEEMAKSTGGTVQKASNIVLSRPMISGISGQEPLVVGTAFAQRDQKDKVSDLIEGSTGVFVVKSTAFTEAPKVASYKTQQSQEASQYLYSSQNRVFEAIKTQSDIDDNRLIRR